jgi:hypothetical protein
MLYTYFIYILGKFINETRVRVMESEFIQYNETLSKHSNYFNKDNYFDIKGNHDNYNYLENEIHYFEKYGMNSNLFEKGKRFYQKVFKKKFGSYRFVGLDTSLLSTPLRQHPYFGYFDNNSLNDLNILLNDTKQYNHTILFSHYPSAFIYDSNDFSLPKKFLELGKKYSIIALLCGRLIILFFRPFTRYIWPNTMQLLLES